MVDYPWWNFPEPIQFSDGFQMDTNNVGPLYDIPALLAHIDQVMSYTDFAEVSENIPLPELVSLNGSPPNIPQYDEVYVNAHSTTSESAETSLTGQSSIGADIPAPEFIQNNDSQSNALCIYQNSPCTPEPYANVCPCLPEQWIEDDIGVLHCMCVHSV